MERPEAGPAEREVANDAFSDGLPTSQAPDRLATTACFAGEVPLVVAVLRVRPRIFHAILSRPNRRSVRSVMACRPGERCWHRCGLRDIPRRILWDEGSGGGGEARSYAGRMMGRSGRGSGGGNSWSCSSRRACAWIVLRVSVRGPTDY